jgi:excinuclease UvrABC nuclease subunit
MTIVPEAFDIQNAPGYVYFLCKNGEVVYIGKSYNIFSNRHGKHRGWKDYDQVYAVIVNSDKLHNFELRMIKQFKPVYNVCNNR